MHVEPAAAPCGITPSTPALPRTACGPNRMQDDTSGVATCTYARIACVEMPAGVRDLEEYWEEPSSYFLTQGELE